MSGSRANKPIAGLVHHGRIGQRMQYGRAGFTLALLAIAAFAACDGGESQAARTCQRNSDCPEGEICNSRGECSTECFNERDCSDGEVCLDGTCTVLGGGGAGGGGQGAGAQGAGAQGAGGGDGASGGSAPTDCNVSGLQVVAGQGLGTVTLDMTAGEVVDVLGCEPVFDDSEFAYVYTDLGIHVVFNDADMDQELDQTETVRELVLRSPFDRTTPDGLGIGSSRDEVVSALGSAAQFVRAQGASLWYASLGIRFVTDPLDVVSELAVFRVQPGYLGADIYPETARLGDPDRCDAGESEQCFVIQAAYTNGEGYVGTTLSEIQLVLSDYGLEPDIFATLISGGVQATVLEYAHLGVSFVSVLLGAEDNVGFVMLSEPYRGTLACAGAQAPPQCGQGVGSTEANVQAALGAPVAIGQSGEKIYEVGSPVGVLLPVLTGRLAIGYDDDTASSWIVNYLGAG